MVFLAEAVPQNVADGCANGASHHVIALVVFWRDIEEPLALGGRSNREPIIAHQSALAIDLESLQLKFT